MSVCMSQNAQQVEVLTAMLATPNCRCVYVYCSDLVCEHRLVWSQVVPEARESRSAKKSRKRRWARQTTRGRGASRNLSQAQQQIYCFHSRLRIHTQQKTTDHGARTSSQGRAQWVQIPQSHCPYLQSTYNSLPPASSLTLPKSLY